MPPQKFLKRFLAIDGGTPESPDSEGAFKSVLSAKKEVDMYAPFITAATAFVDKLVFVDTHANPDTQRDGLAPDISIYAPNNVPDVGAKTDFSKMELFVEFKFAETSDPFRDPLQPRAEKFRFENNSDVSQLNRGQLCSYTAAHAGSQFRVCTFTLSICGRSARFIRWDRSGATVTRSFDYIK
ncbi:hypothetical protein PILCRDRAFT_625276 [Piloderma croceum F 1598]|uniref:Fungal-type protein kinase domain-containing protein n=1 Tax=Piloderma croceum (strain F 1598) TaxID=765440 RepID=A0A0C3ATH6_PILCF|nr:hypothetical protein PILCRDRAFT_625276 [Piloderma croceum F 1598]